MVWLRTPLYDHSISYDHFFLERKKTLAAQQQQKRGGRRGEANETEEEKKNECERASYSFRASRKMPRSSRLAHKAPVIMDNRKTFYYPCCYAGQSPDVPSGPPASRFLIGHLHDGVILLLLPESFRVLRSCANQDFCYLNFIGITKFTYERKNENGSGLRVVKRRHRQRKREMTLGTSVLVCAMIDGKV